MKSKTPKLMATIAVCLFLTLQLSALRADETIRGIGGTGHSANEGGVGGTGHIGSESGIGGTGNVANKAGIGGTGHTQNNGGIGGTGIVGIITGFGSIWVNGLEVQYDAKTQVAANTTAANTNELAIGQVVAIEASNDFKANKISVVNAVEGQISAIDEASGKLTVLGQTVIITTQTLTNDQINKQKAIKFNQGDYVKVSGLRMAKGEIMASRIERTDAIAEPNLVGPITSINGNMIEVYGLQISSASIDQSLSIGQEVIVKGQLKGGILMASSIIPSPSMQLYGHTEHINLQGYVGARTSDGVIKIGNLEVVVSDPSIAANDLSPDQLVQVSGHFANDHRVIADRIEFSRDRPDRVQYDGVGDHEHGVDKIEHGDHAERPDRVDHADRPDSPDRGDHSEVHKSSEHSH